MGGSNAKVRFVFLDSCGLAIEGTDYERIFGKNKRCVSQERRGRKGYVYNRRIGKSHEGVRENQAQCGVRGDRRAGGPAVYLRGRKKVQGILRQGGDRRGESDSFKAPDLHESQRGERARGGGFL